MKRADGMLKAGVIGTRVNKIRQTQLLDSPQTLELWCVDYLDFKSIKKNVPVN
jgi:hypothetical protein